KLETTCDFRFSTSRFRWRLANGCLICSKTKLSLGPIGIPPDHISCVCLVMAVTSSEEASSISICEEYHGKKKRQVSKVIGRGCTSAALSICTNICAIE